MYCASVDVCNCGNGCWLLLPRFALYLITLVIVDSARSKCLLFPTFLSNTVDFSTRITIGIEISSHHPTVEHVVALIIVWPNTFNCWLDSMNHVCRGNDLDSRQAFFILTFQTRTRYKITAARVQNARGQRVKTHRAQDRHLACVFLDFRLVCLVDMKKPRRWPVWDRRGLLRKQFLRPYVFTAATTVLFQHTRGPIHNCSARAIQQNQVRRKLFFLSRLEYKFVGVGQWSYLSPDWIVMRLIITHGIITPRVELTATVYHLSYPCWPTYKPLKLTNSVPTQRFITPSWPITRGLCKMPHNGGERNYLLTTFRRVRPVGVIWRSRVGDGDKWVESWPSRAGHHGIEYEELVVDSLQINLRAQRICGSRAF